MNNDTFFQDLQNNMREAVSKMEQYSTFDDAGLSQEELMALIGIGMTAYRLYGEGNRLVKADR